jgi:hypothetical protein
MITAPRLVAARATTEAAAGDATREGWCGRTTLTHRTGRSASRVSNIASELIEDGDIKRVGGGRHRGEQHYILLPLAVADDPRGSACANPENPVDNPESVDKPMDNDPRGSASPNPKPQVKGSESGSQGSAVSLLPAETPHIPHHPSDDDARAAAAAAVAREHGWPLSHAGRVVQAVTGRAREPVSNPARYVLAAVARDGAANWAPDAPRWRNPPGGGNRDASRPRRCGRCDERTQQVELADGIPARCPACNPLAAS